MEFTFYSDHGKLASSVLKTHRTFWVPYKLVNDSVPCESGGKTAVFPTGEVSPSTRH